MYGERRQSKKLAIPPLPADARKSHSGITALGATPRTIAETEEERTRVTRPAPSRKITIPPPPPRGLAVSSPVDLDAGLSSEDDEQATRLFERPPELAPVTDIEISLDEDVEVTGTPRISRHDVEQVLARLKQEASLEGARAMPQVASVVKASRLKRALLAAVVFAGCTLLWMNPERDVSQLVRRGRITFQKCQATYDAILPFVQGE